MCLEALPSFFSSQRLFSLDKGASNRGSYGLPFLPSPSASSLLKLRAWCSGVALRSVSLSCVLASFFRFPFGADIRQGRKFSRSRDMQIGIAALDIVLSGFFPHSISASASFFYKVAAVES